MKFKNVYFINGNAYAGKSTMIKLLSKKYNGILCEENYQDRVLEKLDSKEFPALTYTRDLKDFRYFIRRTPDEYEKWINDVTKECTIIELEILEELVKENKPIFVLHNCHRLEILWHYDDYNILLRTNRSFVLCHQ